MILVVLEAATAAGHQSLEASAAMTIVTEPVATRPPITAHSVP